MPCPDDPPHTLGRSVTSDPLSPSAPVAEPLAPLATSQSRRPLGRLLRPADFERVLATPQRLRSPHFALHHVEGVPLPARPRLPRVNADAAMPLSSGDAPDTASLSTELSTGPESIVLPGVDDAGRWLGLVVPKRFARRAVTRALLKRQIRDVAAHCGQRLPPGIWVVRLRSPFDPAQFRSAASEPLKAAARGELVAMFDRAMRGERDAPRPRRPRPDKS